ncbi:MAG: ATP-dependent helicase HrpB [Akkermansiaceae bacterium]|nr:ATP-dependent helicase HrpB [Akkermansiaceae bacterium]
MNACLPIDAIRADVLNAVQSPGFCVLLSAPTGSGKSTRIPRMLLDAGVGERGTIIVVQPRRLAARLLAGYVARQFPCKLGAEVGYTVRFDSRCSADTRILFVTDGILERRLTDDPQLKGVSAIIFDEVHERRLSGDLCLARALELQHSTRNDLGVFVMSATLELDKLQAYLPQATILRAEGRMYPVEIEYRPPIPVRDNRGYVNAPPVWEQCAAAVRQLTESTEGDILVFLPGVYEIRRTVEILENVNRMRGREVYALHGQLTPEAQALAVDKGNTPRVIVSTNIAETSLTIEGVRAVVDSGTAREARWDPVRGLSTLHVVPISRAQADQRAGRAGRLGPGKCVRLWSEADHRRRAAFPAPEVHRADISAAFLHLLAWGAVGQEGLRRFAWPDSPTEAQFTQAWQLLVNLGAVSSKGGLTSIGREMMRYPLPPVTARMLVAGQENRCEAEMAAIAALLQSESIAMNSGLHDSLRHEGDFTDFQAEWRALERAEQLRGDTAACTALGIMARAAREIRAAYHQLAGHRATPDFAGNRQGVVRALLAAYPDNVAARNSTATHTARLTQRRSGKLTQGVALLPHAELVVAAEIAEIGGKSVETRISRCTLINSADLVAHEDDIAVFDTTRKRVLNYHRILYRDLVLREKETGDAHPDAAASLLADQVVRGNLRLEGWDGHVLQWINRLTCLRNAMPELEMPDFGEDDRLVAITMLCEGAVCYKDIAARPVLPVLQEWLSPWQKECLNRYAPKVIKLSNGREVKLLYREDGTPTFGLKCQLLFGVTETPTIADGRVKCLVEILAPNQRPYQITSDLPSFWKNGYPQMKKDLAGRYPKHHWPNEAPIL